MKTAVKMILGAAVLAALAAPASAAILTSKHDFRETGGGSPVTGVTDACSTCHVPHRPLMNVPLWAHAFSTYDYYLYNSNASYIGPNTGKYDAAFGVRNAFTNSMSKTCLGCHDGSVAYAGGLYITRAANPEWIMWDRETNAASGEVGDGLWSSVYGLKGSHPVGVTYAGMLPVAEYNAVPGGSVVLENGKVQCVSCHNAHNRFPKMLVETNANSALCLECHVK
ncbi:MAG: cytochrome c3 family protein [Candidatus Coatesbacteria bacterium]